MNRISKVIYEELKDKNASVDMIKSYMRMAFSLDGLDCDGGLWRDVWQDLMINLKFDASKPMNQF